MLKCDNCGGRSLAFGGRHCPKCGRPKTKHKMSLSKLEMVMQEVRQAIWELDNPSEGFAHSTMIGMMDSLLDEFEIVE